MIINVRGTSGSGKSTVVRKIIEQSPSTDRVFLKGRKQPLLYRLKFPDQVISIPGHYETACGGCDTIPTYDLLFQVIREEHAAGHTVLFEGLLVAHDKKRTLELWDWLERKPNLLQVIELTETLQVCLDSVEQRRASRKNPPKQPFNPANTVRRYSEVVRSCKILEEAGIKIHRCNRTDAVAMIEFLTRLRLPSLV